MKLLKIISVFILNLIVGFFLVIGLINIISPLNSVELLKGIVFFIFGIGFGVLSFHISQLDGET